MANISEIKEIAKLLNLSNLAKGKIDINADYKNKLDYLEYVLREELSYGKKTRIKNNKEISNLPNIKFNKSYLVDGVKWQIKEIEKLKFIEEDRNIIITGSCGTGKTALSAEIGNAALDKGYRNKQLADEQIKNNYLKSKTRCRTEHVFGFITKTMFGKTVRSIGIKRTEFNIGLTNLIYNMFRYNFVMLKNQ